MASSKFWSGTSNTASPYVVLLGDVRVGKSTLVEKLCGVQGLRSTQSTSFTQEATEYVVGDDPQGTIVCDTPGTNPMAKRFEHNFHIASAMSRQPVGLLLIVVKADTGVSNVIDAITKYAEGFLEFNRIVGVCVTHMDTVTWKEPEFRSALDQNCGIESVMFSRLLSTSAQLLQGLKSIIQREPMNISIDCNNFLQFFRINDRNMKILASVRKEVQRFETIRQRFYQHQQRYRSLQQVDLIFEFQAWMLLEIEEAKKRVAEHNDFTFCDDSRLANEAGHIASLTNQLKTILHDVRIKSLEHAAPHGVSDLRSCPHCGCVWAKVVGCDGQTTCGELVDGLDVREGSNGVMATFKFIWNESAQELQIDQMEDRQARKIKSHGNKGCGQNIIWSQMASVSVPPEFSVTQPVKTDDVGFLPEQAKQSWDKFFNEKMAQIGVRNRRSVPSKSILRKFEDPMLANRFVGPREVVQSSVSPVRQEFSVPLKGNQESLEKLKNDMRFRNRRSVPSKSILRKFEDPMLANRFVGPRKVVQRSVSPVRREFSVALKGNQESLEKLKNDIQNLQRVSSGEI